MTRKVLLFVFTVLLAVPCLARIVPLRYPSTVRVFSRDKEGLIQKVAEGPAPLKQGDLGTADDFEHIELDLVVGRPTQQVWTSPRMEIRHKDGNIWTLAIPANMKLDGSIYVHAAEIHGDPNERAFLVFKVTPERIGTPARFFTYTK